MTPLFPYGELGDLPPLIKRVGFCKRLFFQITPIIEMESIRMNRDVLRYLTTLNPKRVAV
jgi:hypothetical protein